MAIKEENETQEKFRANAIFLFVKTWNIRLKNYSLTQLSDYPPLWALPR